MPGETSGQPSRPGSLLQTTKSSVSPPTVLQPSNSSPRSPAPASTTSRSTPSASTSPPSQNRTTKSSSCPTFTRPPRTSSSGSRRGRRLRNQHGHPQHTRNPRPHLPLTRQLPIPRHDRVHHSSQPRRGTPASGRCRRLFWPSGRPSEWAVGQWAGTLELGGAPALMTCHMYTGRCRPWLFQQLIRILDESVMWEIPEQVPPSKCCWKYALLLGPVHGGVSSFGHHRVRDLAATPRYEMRHIRTWTSGPCYYLTVCLSQAQSDHVG
jgi:hypothetical protein